MIVHSRGVEVCCRVCVSQTARAATRPASRDDRAKPKEGIPNLGALRLQLVTFIRLRWILINCFDVFDIDVFVNPTVRSCGEDDTTVQACLAVTTCCRVLARIHQSRQI